MTEQKHSDQIQDIISAPPKWLIRWGVTLVLLCFLLFFYFARIVHYPEIVHGRFTITRSVVISSILPGEFINTIKQEVQNVKTGDKLGYILSQKGQTQLLSAPIAGKLYRLNATGQLSNVKKDDQLFAIQNDSAGLIGQLIISAAKAGKVKVGQQVILRPDQVTPKNGGTLYGVISALSTHPDINNNLYGQIRIKRKSPVNTNIQSGLSGDANIICEQITLADRLISNIQSTLFKR